MPKLVVKLALGAKKLEIELENFDLTVKQLKEKLSVGE